MSTILNYLRYPSTWKGIIAALAAMVPSLGLSEDKQEAIITAGVALFAAVSIFFSDADVKPPAK